MDNFDRLIGNLHGLPDVSQTKPATVRAITPLLGNVETWIVSTVRQKDQGDYIFIESVSEAGSLRIVLPPAVSAVVARQRDALGTITRRKVGRRVMAERMAAGWVPSFTAKAKDKRKGAK